MEAVSPVSDGVDEIPQGRRLVRARSDVGLSLAERLTGHFYRLTWRTPLHALRLRGRYPLKILAVPDDKVAGDKGAGEAILAGNFAWRGEVQPCDGIDFGNSAFLPGFVQYLHRFEWLRDLAAAGTRAEAAPRAEALTRAWLAAHAEKVSEPAWRPDLWGWRILYWAAHAPLILSSTDLVYRSAVLNALARGARHLDRTADRAPAGLPQIAAWTGVVAAGLLIAGGNPRRSFGEAGLFKALNNGIGADGGLICRTPQGQLDVVTLLSMLVSVYEARKMDCPTPLLDALEAAVPPLLSLTIGDGGFSSWQGCLPLPAALIESVIAASGIRTRPLRHAREWGYQRAAAGQTVLVADAAPPPLGRVSGGGCASTLAFELSDGPHRLVVNCGGGNASSSYVPANLADGLRTTAAHSTLIVADSNSTAIHGDGTIGKGVTEVELERTESEGGSRIEASHDGYVRRFGLIHRRTFLLAADGREVRGEDVLLPAKAKQKPVTTAFALRFHLAPGIEATQTADGQGALLRIAGGPLWQFRCRGASLAIDESLWVDGEGKPRGAVQLVALGESPPGGANVSWSFKRAG
jgi:uncharacterized heparinase superfamily protein